MHKQQKQNKEKHQTKMFLHSKGNQQNEKATFSSNKGLIYILKYPQTQ